ncbi:hypothetical protein L484_016652 [Morus notabilis]|uniref:Uncharacterized protein n=1 Tax=Morus notabilis TaxID=981085 RepID=W9RM07_9ROSA|nr:hypothetical protein L484_016652 [Morus notabilis]
MESRGRTRKSGGAAEREDSLVSFKKEKERKNRGGESGLKEKNRIAQSFWSSPRGIAEEERQNLEPEFGTANGWSPDSRRLRRCLGLYESWSLIGVVHGRWRCKSGKLEYSGAVTLRSQPLIDMVQGKGDWCWRWRHGRFSVARS